MAMVSKKLNQAMAGQAVAENDLREVTENLALAKTQKENLEQEKTSLDLYVLELFGEMTGIRATLEQRNADINVLTYEQCEMSFTLCFAQVQVLYPELNVSRVKISNQVVEGKLINVQTPSPTPEGE